MMTKNIDSEAYEQAEPEKTVHLAEHLQICRRRIWLIVSFMVVFSGLAALWAFSQNPIYQAIAGFMIEPLHPVVLQTAQYPEEWESDLFSVRIETHTKLLISYPVLEETARRINLVAQPEYQASPSIVTIFTGYLNPVWVDTIKGWVREIKQKISGIGDASGGTTGKIDNFALNPEPAGIQPDLVKDFGKKILIDYVKGSKLLNVTVESESPEFAAHAANSLINVYMERIARQRSQEASSTTEWYSNHLEGLREDVKKSELAVYGYRVKNGLVDVSEAQTVAEQQLIEQNKELANVETSRSAAQTRYQQIQLIQAKLRADSADGQPLDRSELDSLTELRTYAAIQELRAKEVALSVQIARLSEKYGPLHPTMVHGQTELKELRFRIDHEIDGIYHAAKQDYLLWLARERAAKEMLAKRKKEKLALEKLAVQYRLLERKATSDRQLYDLFLKQMSEKNISAQIETTNMYLAEPAIPNPTPVRPRPLLITLLALIAGMGAAVGLAFFLEYWDRSLKGPKDVERHLADYTWLGWIPRLSWKRNLNMARIVESEPLSPVADSFRHLRTALRLTVSSAEPMSFVITSPGENEGKTTLAVNLAISISQLESTRVVLVDAHFRQPSVDKIFGIKREKDKPKGLKHFLLGEAEVGEILYQTTVTDLVVIPSGGQEHRATELLHSKRLNTFFSWCRQQGFHVIVDAPPALAFADVSVIATQVYGVLLVVSSGETTVDASKIALQRLGAHGAQFLGIVMQKVPRDRVPDYSR